MLVNEIKALNFDKLYKTVAIMHNNKKEETGYESKFGENLRFLLEHVEITFILNYVNIYEAYLLKLNSSRCSILYNTSFFGDMNTMIGPPKKYAAVINSIIDDKKIDIETRIRYAREFVPAFFIQGDMTVTFTGTFLINLLGFDIDEFFMSATDSDCATVTDNGVIFKEDYQITDQIYGYLKNKFVNAFEYTGLHRIQTNDIFSDMGIYNFFSKRNDENKTEISISCIYNPYIMKNFTDGSDYKELVSIYKDTITDVLFNERYPNTYIELNLFTPLINYFELFNVLPKEFFISNDSLIRVFNERKLYIPDELEDYKEKLTDRMADIEKNVSEMGNTVLKYSHSYLNTMISYSMKFSLEDVNLYINRINKKYISKSTSNIVDRMIKIAKAASNLVLK